MCVIVAHPTSEGIFLYKSRDRNYVSRIALVHTILNNTELAFIFDLQTGWVEGINEHGIGLVNSALSVFDDEKEIDKSKTVSKPRLSKDGQKILHALTLSNIDDCYAHLAMTRLTGHTFLSDSRNVLVIEQTGQHLAKIEKITNLKRTLVRTNHGILHTDTGYLEGVDRLSSSSRLYETIKAVSSLGDGKLIAEVLREVESPLGRYFNPVRADLTKRMVTRSQLSVDLTNLHLTLSWIPGRCEFSGTLVRLPEGYTPKIQLSVEKLTEFAEKTK